MKPGKKFTQISKYNPVILIGTLAFVMAAFACTSKPKPAAVSHSASPAVQTTAMQMPATAVVKTVSAPVESKISAPTKSASKPVTFKSRDYGVSFVYPWQYAYINAKTIANSGALLSANHDGHDGQFTLARVEIPKGFYPDTDFKNAYFVLSLNQEVGEQDCYASYSSGKDAKPKTETINGVDFRWTERESGGRGSADRVRNYVAFANDTCYEMEVGVKTENDGLAREVDPDQIMHRLDAIVKTVKIDTGAEKEVAPQLQSSAEEKPSTPQN